MNKYALTGNMGCGKSTVLRHLSCYKDIVTIECDKLAKDVLSAPTHRVELVSMLGPESFVGQLPNTKLIAQRVFHDARLKKRLEDFLHPLVWRKVGNLWKNLGPEQICVVESAIVFESGMEYVFDGVITATCGLQEQMHRLALNRKMQPGEIEARLSCQLSSEEKMRRSDFVIDTGCDCAELNKRIETLYRKLKERVKHE